jgi:hypothetical protein
MCPDIVGQGFLFILFFWGGGRGSGVGHEIDSKYMNQIEVPQKKKKKRDGSFLK